MNSRNRVGSRHEDWDYPKSETNCFMYIQHQIHQDYTNIPNITSNPHFDEFEWKYWQIIQFCMQLNDLLCLLQQECTIETCNEMKAGEWFYLCANHQEPTGCCAIDYIVHTLEGASSLLLSDVCVKDSSSSEKLLQNIARRLYRIFGHAYYHHRQIFLEFEATTKLYSRFLELAYTKYQFLNEKMIVIPPLET
jgi:hypothetical protein